MLLEIFQLFLKSGNSNIMENDEIIILSNPQQYEQINTWTLTVYKNPVNPRSKITYFFLTIEKQRMNIMDMQKCLSNKVWNVKAVCNTPMEQ